MKVSLTDLRQDLMSVCDFSFCGARVCVHPPGLAG